MGEERKLVSIIIPAYNIEKYIDRCLESLLAQTYSQLEVLVVDDGSTDDTWSHIEQFMAKDKRVKGFRRENAGVSAARNFALDMATGFYIQFVDSDDYLNENAVEVLVNAIETSGAAWVNCQYNRVDEAGNKLEEYSFLKGYKIVASPEERFSLIRNELLDYHIGYEVWDKLFLASIIKEKELRFNEACHIGEDLAFNICYGYYASSINCIEDRLYNYLVRSDSAMDNAKSLSKNFAEHLELVKGIEPEFNKAFENNPEIKDKFYQLFYKLMLHGCWRHTAPECIEEIRKIKDSYYENYLSEALKHKEEFDQFFLPEMARLYYRFGLYIKAHLEGDFLEQIYLRFYDLYRSLRKRDTLKEWRLS